MREALVICPFADNHGRTLIDLLDKAVGAMVDAFGGCTVRDSRGAWKSPRGAIVKEPVWELVAACDDTPNNREALQRIAHMIGNEGEQEAVYLRYPSGDVEILDTASDFMAAHQAA